MPESRRKSRVSCESRNGIAGASRPELHPPVVATGAGKGSARSEQQVMEILFLSEKIPVAKAEAQLARLVRDLVVLTPSATAER